MELGRLHQRRRCPLAGAGRDVGSGNRRKAKRKLAKLHRKIANRRLDFHHKTARRLIDSSDVIAVEDLATANMTRSASGTTVEPGRNVAAKAGLNRSILDAGWGQFISILVAKAEGAGRRVVKVDPRDTSRTCHRCRAHCTRPRQDTLACPTHGAMDADWNRPATSSPGPGWPLTGPPEARRSSLSRRSSHKHGKRTGLSVVVPVSRCLGDRRPPPIPRPEEPAKCGDVSPPWRWPPPSSPG